MMEENPKNELENTSEEFSFLQETVKKEPVQKWLFKKSLQFGIAGLLIGILATMAYYAFAPLVAERFRERPEKVTIPQDGEVVDVSQKEDAITVNGPEIVEETYEEKLKAIFEAAERADKCMVTVSSAAESETEEPQMGVSGIVVADNGLDLLILVSNSVCENTQSWEIRFVDDTVYPAVLVKQDKNTGLAVFAVARENMKEESLKTVEIAVLGNSSMMVEGKTAIAKGNIFNPENEVNSGSIISAKYEMELADGRYSILGTDIAIMQDGAGVLFNTAGEVVGLVMPEIWSETDELFANAYAISDLKPTIEKLSNGEGVPYAGIHGATVDEKTAEEQGLPQGMYVRQVDADSPAMNAGIQNGDVLTEIGDTKISSVFIYQRALQKLNAGEVVRIRGQRRGTDGFVDIEYTMTVGSWE